MIELNASQLTWVPEQRMLVIEASEVPGFHRPQPLAITSERGTRIVCHLDRVKCDSEGDVVAWIFRPAPDALVRTFAVHVLND